MTVSCLMCDCHASRVPATPHTCLHHVSCVSVSHLTMTVSWLMCAHTMPHTLLCYTSRVTSHGCLHHITHMPVSGLTHAYVKYHAFLHYASHAPMSHLTHDCIMSHTHMCCISHVPTSCLMHAYVTSHACMHTNSSRGVHSVSPLGKHLRQL